MVRALKLVDRTINNLKNEIEIKDTMNKNQLQIFKNEEFG